MIARRRARHLRRRSWPLRIVLLVVAVLGTGSGVVAVRALQERQRIRVTIQVGGVRHTVKVAAPATVGAALEAGEIVPRAGRLLSIVTNTVLDPDHAPPQLTVDGAPAGPEAPVVAGATIGVVEPPDAVETTVDGSEPVPPPPMPTVIHAMWRPGHPGLALSRKGSVSGEVVAQQEVQASVPPAPVTDKLVALTFDDGPSAHTGDVLRILREKNVKATFCVVTNQLKGGGLALAKGALAEGHRLCNHTTNHDQKLPSKSQKAIEDNINDANAHLLERTGTKPAYYRPPGGSMGPKIDAAVKAAGQQVLLWTVDTKDFQKPPVEAIIGSVMGGVRPGGVVLLHDGGGDRNATVTALPAIIDQLRAAGYELVLPDAVAPVAAAPVTATALPA